MWFVPIVLIAIFGLIEGIHISMHSKFCKTEAQWMNEQEGMSYDRESNVQ